MVVEWPAPPEGVWKLVGIRVAEEASVFDLVEVLAHQSKLVETPIECAIFLPNVQLWETHVCTAVKLPMVSSPTPNGTHHDTIPSSGLGLVESRVGVGDELGRRVGLVEPSRDAYADRHRDSLTVRLEEEGLDLGSKALGQHQGVLDRGATARGPAMNSTSPQRSEPKRSLRSDRAADDLAERASRARGPRRGARGDR